MAAPNVQDLNISDDKKGYIVNQLNPILEEMVAECIHTMPQDPVPFMLSWLQKKKVSDDDKVLTADERARLEKQNTELEAEIGRVRSQVQECAKLAAADGSKNDDSEEEDDDDEPPPPNFDKFQSKGARQSVSAEAYGQWNQKKAFVPPVIIKEDEQKERLRDVLGRSFLFSSLEETDFGIIIGAMKEVILSQGEEVIKQGDSGDFLFVIEKGDFDCLIGDKVVKTCQSGDVFGELALLYNCPRAATVKSKTPSVCWQLDRDTFNNIVREAAQKKRERYDAFLSKVPLLSSMDAYERSQLADALKNEAFSDGQSVVMQGDVGNKFYIVEEGKAYATKDGIRVMEYSAGDYFGELALISNQPRAAAVIVTGGPARLLSIDKSSFNRLLNVSELLKRSEKYN